jgi:hypothetical protein
VLRLGQLPQLVPPLHEDSLTFDSVSSATVKVSVATSPLKSGCVFTVFRTASS